MLNQEDTVCYQIVEEIMRWRSITRMEKIIKTFQPKTGALMSHLPFEITRSVLSDITKYPE